MKGLTRQYDFVTTLSRYQTALGWDNYANDHEDANSQFESNFRYADALTTADRLVFFRYMVHTLAQQRGMLATFMPKPFTHLTGNGCHMHISLWDAGRDAELFLDDADDPRGLGTRSWPTTSSAGCWSTPGLHRRHRARPSTPTSGSRSGRRTRAPPGRRFRRPTAATTGPR